MSDQYEKGDAHSKEKQLTYEEMLAESKSAYIQLDEQYKSMVEKLQSENALSLKQTVQTYQQKISSTVYA